MQIEFCFLTKTKIIDKNVKFKIVIIFMIALLFWIVSFMLIIILLSRYVIVLKV